jgi:hypothetical protein
MAMAVAVAMAMAMAWPSPPPGVLPARAYHDSAVAARLRVLQGSGKAPQGTDLDR